MYITRTSEVAGVSRAELMRELDAKPAVRHAPRGGGGPPELSQPDDEPVPAVRRRDRRADFGGSGVRAERELIRLLLHQRRYGGGS
jgi:hypothetical protein